MPVHMEAAERPYMRNDVNCEITLMSKLMGVAGRPSESVVVGMTLTWDCSQAVAYP